VIESLRRRASRFGLDIILVDVWEGADGAQEAARYCEMWGIEATVLIDQTAAYARTLGVRGVPTNVFVDERGLVRSVGATTPEELLREAAQLVPALRGQIDDLLRADHPAAGFGAEPPRE